MHVQYIEGFVNGGFCVLFSVYSGMSRQHIITPLLGYVQNHSERCGDVSCGDKECIQSTTPYT